MEYSLQIDFERNGITREFFYDGVWFFYDVYDDVFLLVDSGCRVLGLLGLLVIGLLGLGFLGLLGLLVLGLLAIGLGLGMLD